MSKYILFDEMLKIFYKLSPMVGLKDILQERPLKVIILHRLFYAISALNLAYCIYFTIVIAGEAMAKGMFMARFLALAELIACGLGAIIYLCKSLNMVMKSNQIRQLLQELRDMWPEANANEEILKCMIETVRSPTKLLWWFYIIEMTVPIFYMCIPMVLMTIQFISEGRITDLLLPVYEEYPFDWRTSIWLYLLCYLSQIMASLFANFNEPCTHGIMITLLTNLTLQCKLISISLTRVGEPIEDESPSDDNQRLSPRQDDQVNKQLEMVIKKHKTVLELCGKFEDIFSTIMALNFFLSGLVICQQIITFTMGEFHDAPKHVAYTASIILQMLMPCWYSEILAQESCMIGYGAYCSGWYRMAARDKSSLRLLQTRAQKAVTVRASAFFTVNLDTFIAIMKTAWSYFVLLQTLYNE